MKRINVGYSLVVFILAGLLLAGCGGSRGTEERIIELTFVPSDQLNWDGDNANTLQVGVFVLSNADAFQQAAVTAILDDDEDEEYITQFIRDRIDHRIYTVRPGAEQKEIMVYVPGPNDPKRVQLGIIADYFDPAEDAAVRRVLMTDDKREEIRIILGKDRLEMVSRE